MREYPATVMAGQVERAKKPAPRSHKKAARKSSLANGSFVMWPYLAKLSLAGAQVHATLYHLGELRSPSGYDSGELVRRSHIRLRPAIIG